MIPFSDSRLFGEGSAVLEPRGGLLLVKNRIQPYSSPALRLTPASGGRTRYCLKLASSAQPVTLAVCHKLRYIHCSQEFIAYDTDEKVLVTDQSWVWLSGDFSFVPGLQEVTAYFIQDAGTPLCDIWVKEIVAEEIPPAQKPKAEISRQPFSVGAIRWDAYFSTEDIKSNVSRQVARALSPKKFHWRAPFFSKEEADGSLSFPPETQERFDTEAELAIAAGIDYFAYCWYRDNDPMSYARKRHAQSKYRDRIKMTAIVRVSGLDDETLAGLAQQMKEEYYLKFDGRPVLYVFDAVHADGAYRAHITRAAQSAGNPDPYYIGMNAQPQPYPVYKIEDMGFDAIGSYGFVSDRPGEPYASFARRNEDMCRMRYSLQTRLDHVPLLCLGHDFRPRIENPVSWMTGKHYSLPASPEEIYRHAETILRMHKEQEENKPNTLLIYAWNEHDEGGWICPTLTQAPDKGVDDGYYQALKRAVCTAKEQFKNSNAGGKTHSAAGISR